MTAHVDPAQAKAESTPLPSLAIQVCETPIPMSRSTLRSLNAATREAIMNRDDGIRFKYRGFLERSLMRQLKQREFIVLSAIVARTLSYGKFAEEIPISQFKYGVRDPGSRELVLDECGNPWFEGTGMDKNTITGAIEDLSRKGLISIYSIPNKGTKDVHAFSWMSLRNMFAAVVEVDPENAPRFGDVLGDSPLCVLAILRDAAHDLEERCGSLFPGGLAYLKEDQLRKAKGLEVMQRKYLGR